MKKKLKLYLHHEHYEPISYNKKVGFFRSLLNSVVKIFEYVGHGLIMICFAIGYAIIQIILTPVTLYKFALKLPRTLSSVFRKIHNKSFQKTVISFSLVALILGAGIHGLSLVAVGQNIKGEVLGSSDVGLGYLQDAKNSLEAQNTQAAQANFNKALEQFRNSRESLNSTSLVLKGLLSVVPQKQDADKLLKAAEKITEAAIKATELMDLTSTTKLSAVGMNGGDKNREILQHAEALINESVDLANEAAKLINDVSITSIPENHRSQFIAAKDTANFFQTNVSSLKEVCSLMFDLLLGSKNTLLIFENNNELRANGGFMGTLGNAKLADGTLTSLDIRSVYDWDGQLKERIMPPQPLFAVNDRWYLRDSNWFANFPDSASRIKSLFEKEGGETADLVIVMTPELIIEMLERTGPITLPQHGITLTKDNFIEETQIATSINYDKVQNQPKQFLADFFPLLMEKLGTSENGGIIGFLEIFQQNLYKKQIILHSRDQSIQRKISGFNWGGEVRDTDRDYLSIINSNLGGTKTDRSMQRSINLKSDIAQDGTITNTLTYTVKNPLPSGPSLINKSFIRFYVPQNSKLTSSTGFDTNQLPDISTIYSDQYILDDMISDWQRSVSQDTSSGTYTGQEAGKTWFGNWLEVGGGQTKTVTLTYALPFKVDSIDRHSLLLQKQVGSQADLISYELSFPGRSSLWKSNSASVDNDHLKYEQNLIADTFLGTVLEK